MSSNGYNVDRRGNPLLEDKDDPAWDVTVTGTYTKRVHATTPEQAEEIVMDRHFDPAYLKDKIKVEVESAEG